MIFIDIPQVAYKTWCLEYRVINEDGTRDYFKEKELENDLREALVEYKYSSGHDHVK